MCPLTKNMVRFLSRFGKFVMLTTGGHMGPPLRRGTNVAHNRPRVQRSESGTKAKKFPP